MKEIEDITPQLSEIILEVGGELAEASRQKDGLPTEDKVRVISNVSYVQRRGRHLRLDLDVIMESDGFTIGLKNAYEFDDEEAWTAHLRANDEALRAEYDKREIAFTGLDPFSDN